MNDKISTDKIINVGLAGFGMSGEIFQAPFLHANPKFAIKKVFERNSERSRKEYPTAEIVRSFEELLSPDIDLIVISTPNQQHFPMAKMAMEANKNVIVEKPIAISVEQAKELCEIAITKNVLFSVYQNRRLDGDFLTVKKLIEDGRMGEILDYEVHYDRFVRSNSTKVWKASGGKGVNILYDLGVHIIDQAYTLFGMPREVYADFRKQRQDDTEFDNFEVILYYDDKKATLSASEVVAKEGPRYMINGRKGSFHKYGLDVQEAALISGKRPAMASTEEPWGKDLEANYGTLYYDQDGTIVEEKIPTIDGNYGKYYENIYQALTLGDAPNVKPEEAVDVLYIIEAAEKSHSEKRRIAI